MEGEGQAYASIGYAGIEPLTGRMEPIAVEQFDYGYKLTLGGRTFAVEQAGDVGHAIYVYLFNPKETTARYLSHGRLPRIAPLPKASIAEEERGGAQ